MFTYVGFKYMIEVGFIASYTQTFFSKHKLTHKATFQPLAATSTGENVKEYTAITIHLRKKEKHAYKCIFYS